MSSCAFVCILLRLGKALRSSGVYSEEELVSLFGEADKDDSRALSFEEFAATFQDLAGPAAGSSLEDIDFSEMLARGHKQTLEIQKRLEERANRS